MSGSLVVFEDDRWRDLRPLTDLVPVPALAFGGSSLAERLAQASGLPLGFLAARAAALAACRTVPQPAATAAAGALVFANAAALPGPWLGELVAATGPLLLRRGDRILGARVDGDAARAALAADAASRLAAAGLPSREAEARLLEWPWQIVEWNAEAITEDLAALPGTSSGAVHAAVTVLGAGRVTVEAGARVDPGAVLDARQGPVLVRRGAIVGAHTLVVGPCVVGEATQLLGGSIARSTIGRECRIAGEVEESVWQGFGNKRHHGFVGHSVVGEWVNLGALTTTSDLKNNYGSVRVAVDGRVHDTGASKVGSLIGAHVKTGIGTLLPTGASIGTGANLFGGGRFAPRAVPSFGWWDGAEMSEHRLDAFIRTARMAMSRRNQTAGPADDSAWAALFEATRAERAGPPRDTLV
jgi:UDP-N-acetylglucosamine diphosphorylase/glucosamine-1-phosphate N-acetyltransferase